MLYIIYKEGVHVANMELYWISAYVMFILLYYIPNGGVINISRVLVINCGDASPGATWCLLIDYSQDQACDWHLADWHWQLLQYVLATVTVVTQVSPLQLQLWDKSACLGACWGDECMALWRQKGLSYNLSASLLMWY